jgi:hypothetical protein
LPSLNKETLISIGRYGHFAGKPAPTGLPSLLINTITAGAGLPAMGPEKPLKISKPRQFKPSQFAQQNISLYFNNLAKWHETRYSPSPQRTTLKK